MGSANFSDQLQRAWDLSNSQLCVGLDPDLSRFPAEFSHTPQGIEDFCKAMVDATAQHVCAFKPQIAYFAAQGAEKALENVIAHIRKVAKHAVIVLDAKRGDIGATARQYASEAFERFDADALTINPYMGTDSIEPYFDFPDRGLFLLCRTSNPGGSDLQFLDVAPGEKLYQRVAKLAHERWNPHGQTGLVVGATFPAELAAVRKIVGDMPLLVPGIGAQGGDIEATVKAGRNSKGLGLLINSSRAVLYASQESDYAECAARVAEETKLAIAKYSR
ncbi:MAG: orotidine-5'-phosphate decarboxylase [Burkholderiales bacterium]|jgi:orotidine-5'-phosphate decarboxylase|nr:orotidine-5'-phosphate decarboxylase [Burkholderiales bacterium]